MTCVATSGEEKLSKGPKNDFPPWLSEFRIQPERCRGNKSIKIPVETISREYQDYPHVDRLVQGGRYVKVEIKVPGVLKDWVVAS